MALFREYPGYKGIHTREQAEGAIKNKSRILKAFSEKGDSHPVGSLGTVLGSFKVTPDVAEEFGAPYFYFVEWDSTPGLAVGVVGTKIAEVG